MYNNCYIEERRRREIYASPVYASQEALTGLPPFAVITAEKDALGEEAELFVSLLLKAGVTVTAKRVKGAEHGFLVRRSIGFETAENLLFDIIDQYLK